MSSGAVLVIAILVLVVLAAVFVMSTAARRDRAAALRGVSRETRRRDRGDDLLAEVVGDDAAARTGRAVERAAVLERRGGEVAVIPATPAPVAPRAPLDPESYGVTRRQFMNRGIVTLFTLGLASFGGSMLAFLWPQLSGGFGSKIRVGNISDILGQIRTTREPVYVAEGRFYLVPFPSDAVGKARQAYAGGVLEGMEAGLVALYQKCVHLGCRVPWCKSAQWFECPCHGSQYNRVGEKKAGPAPRGLDRFPVDVSGGVVSVDTGALSVGPPVGTNTTGQEAEGPHCT